MDSSLPSSDFKRQLKQQRDRLISKRDAIIQDAIDHATATIDANLAHIDNLLSKADSSPKSKKTATSQEKFSAASNENPILKPEFKDLKLAQAIPLVFKKDAGRIFSIDNVINALYGTIDPSIHAKTRQRIGVSLGHSAGREEILKVQTQPAMYRLN